MNQVQNELIDQLGKLYENAKDLLHQITPAFAEEHNYKTQLYNALTDLRNFGAEAVQCIDPEEKLIKAKGFLAQAMGELNVISES